MRRFFLAVVLVLIIASSSFSEPGEIVYNLGADPRTIDPALNNALDGANVDINIFDGLLCPIMGRFTRRHDLDVSPSG